MSISLLFGAATTGVAPADADPLVRTAADAVRLLTAVLVPAVLFWSARRQTPAVRRAFALVGVFAAGCGMSFALRSIPGGGAWAVAAGSAIALATAVVMIRGLPGAFAAVETEAQRDDLERLRVLEAAVTASGDGVMIAEANPVGLSGPRIVFANPAFEHLMGYSFEEALGMSPSVFCHTDSAVRKYGEPDPEAEAEAAALESIRAALRGTEPVRLELPSRRKDGTRVWAEWQIVPVADEAGRITHWVAVLRDTTERRRLEEQLRESQKMDAVGRLAGGIAHDFNNLLTVIRGNAELLRDGGPDLPRTELVDDIRGAAERAAGLVRQLLTFGRRQTARPVVLDLNTVVEEMAGMLRRLLGERVAVVAALSPTPVRARIDRGQLEQVVMNLAVNAKDAMARGGTLTIATEAVTALRGGQPARFARLVVSDTGVGMTAEVRAKIFEPFFTTKGPGKGTGLGLATVYGIVQQSGGHIGVESAPGAGTSFRVDLPWCDEAPPKTKSFLDLGPARAQGQGHGRTILLAEDEDAVRKLTRAALEGSGYAVCEAPDGETALELLAAGRHVDLLVTDLTMPGMGGQELARRVRLIRPDLGVVFISGYLPDVGRLDVIPGAVFLAKPFTPADLLKAAGKAAARAVTRTPAPV